MIAHLSPNSSDPIKRAMLDFLGMRSLEELYSDVPEEILLKSPPEIGKRNDHIEIESIIDSKLSKKVRLIFTGGGMADHYIPPLVDELASRQEFYTSYTPYQPEFSQGVLQALFEYQSLMAELLGMDVVNASLYDFGSALGEAGRFSIRVTRRKKIVIASNVHPERKLVLRTYLDPVGAEIIEAPMDEARGTVDLGGLEKLVDDSVAMVYIELPNFYGILEERAEDIINIAHSKGALAAIGIDPILAAIIRPPGDLGADLVIGEGQHLGSPMSFGGPSLGIFAVRMDMRLVRQLPGRLIGMTKSFDGQRGYCMVLQTREQHIRREEATSNITTSSSLMAIRAAIYLALLGPGGLRKLAEKILYNTAYLKERISKIKGFKIPFTGINFKELAVSSSIPWERINSKLLSNGILGGFVVSGLFPEMDRGKNIALFSTTEKHGKAEIDMLVDLMGEVGE
ncbi:aminomethyl-transferring glycine dehydrogenase subunit GcvPA [Candidatus Korarchaeum cryptofilum]|jgi:glycine dehydrogenase subunit 1|uniref:Probable glycine dehydrogenase (decarboxylating) subunit 1 n=1 Tax=Candidatus Korarchaeum cryptofilum TaxID=498846 RepID=A0A3R9QT25_9CREN|nr:aminomethyl-transferring glycine dehydrogenase subunit GcvPA [Candidatus Korarchaeum cryptofilum]RSN70111.1 aminomethyl-transferring glycine dehydrogenase subunit GcvPA [Candidatus Korarchaeum cryptofilum]